MRSTPPGMPGGSAPAWDAVLTPLTPQDPRQIGGYLLRARIGAGGMGVVYLSYTPGGRPVAIKVARPEFSADPEFRRRFAAEVAIAQRVQGLYTAPVIDCAADAAQPWLATAYVPAPSLAAAVARQGALPSETVLLLIAGVAEALQSIHAVGVIHRDLKPGNVILAADGPRVIDFGISRAVEASSAGITQTGARVGTPAFMAPEQIQGKSLGPAGDIFSLGATAYYGVTGELPFGADAAVFHRVVYEQPDWDHCPGHVREILKRCVEKDLADRPTPGELIELCREASTDERLRIGEGWLPPTVAADLTRYNLTPPMQSSPSMPWTEPASRLPPPSPWLPPPIPGATSPNRSPRRGWIVRGISAAVLLIALLAVIGNIFSDSKDQGGNTVNPFIDTISSSPSALPTNSPPIASPSHSSPSNPAAPATTAVLAQEQLRLREDSVDGVYVDQLPLSVSLGGDFKVYAGIISTPSWGRLSSWSGSGTPTVGDCETVLRTQPMSRIETRAGTRFCVAGSRNIATGHIISYSNGIAQVEITVWDKKFNG